MAHSVTPFLMFSGDAEEAMNLYVSLFPNSEIIEIERYGENGPGMDGDVLQGRISVSGQHVICIDSPVKHEFTFTPASSMFVICDDDREIGLAYSKLVEGGQILMPLSSYTFSPGFAWVQDRYGVSWQLSLMRK